MTPETTLHWRQEGPRTWVACSFYCDEDRPFTWRIRATKTGYRIDGSTPELLMDTDSARLFNDLAGAQEFCRQREHELREQESMTEAGGAP